MGDTITPITAGATYRDVSCGDQHGDHIRVRSVWVDEDYTVNVSLNVSQSRHSRRISKPTVTLDDFLERLESEELIRTNSDHDAWEWRQD